MTAFIFPGQGSQKVGMGADLAEASAAAREVFQEVDDALNQKLSVMMREGTDAELTLTSNAQPAIMANAIATLRVLEKDFGVKLKSAASCVAGHSLGEYTALCAVNAFSLTDTAKLLRLRGIAMQDAVPIGVGGTSKPRRSWPKRPPAVRCARSPTTMIPRKSFFLAMRRRSTECLTWRRNMA